MVDLISRILASKYISKKGGRIVLLADMDIIRDYIGPGVPYISMRVFCALNGVLTVPIAYWTMRQSGHSVASAVVAALMVCYGKYQETGI